MLARASLAALLLAHIPFAWAFPPCPIEPLDLESIDSGSIATIAAPWYQAQYALVGDPSIIDLIKPLQRVPDHGKCRDYDALPVPTSHLDGGAVGLSGGYAPVSGFGVVALPDLRTLPQAIRLRHTLDFRVDNAPLATVGDWIDLAELRLQPISGKAGMEAPQASTLYRVRKRQNETAKTVLEVIQAEGSDAEGSMLEARSNVIVRFEMTGDLPDTRIMLRLSQFKTAVAPIGDTIDPIIGDPVQIEADAASSQSTAFAGDAQTSTGEYIVEPLNVHDSQLEVLDGDGVALARVWLGSQWPSELSMGLLNYNVQSASAYPNGHGVWIREMSLRAEEF